MSHPRDPRLRRQAPFAPPVDVGAAALRLEVAADSWRAAARDVGPEPLEPAPLVEAAGDYAERLGELLDGALPAADSPEPAPVSAPLPPVDGVEPAPAPQLVPEPTPCRGCGVADPEGRLHVRGERKCCPDCDHRPAPAPVLNIEQRRPAARGWSSRHDPRSLEFGARRLMAGSVPLQDVTLPTPAPLDQGQEGECVGCGVVQAENVMRLLAGRSDLLTVDDAAAVYATARRHDGIPDSLGEGTSVNAGMQAGRDAGYWPAYSWDFGTRDIAQTLLRRRPVIVGVPWLSGMAETGPGGLVRLEGDDVGIGHCLVIVALRLLGPQGQPGPFFGWLNSYGESYGDGGIGRIHHRDLARLLHGIGEAATPMSGTRE